MGTQKSEDTAVLKKPVLNQYVLLVHKVKAKQTEKNTITQAMGRATN